LLQGKALQDALAWVGHWSLSEQHYQFLIASQELEKRELFQELETSRQAIRYHPADGTVCGTQILHLITHRLAVWGYTNEACLHRL
jgi:hypothetical protein